MNNSKIFTVVGLMSGTSMDGVDAAVLRTDGEQVIESLGHLGLSYQPDFRASLKTIEQLASKYEGNLKKMAEDSDLGPLLEEVTAKSAAYHRDAVQKLLAEIKITKDDIDLIGYHGQTLYHDSAKGVTLQIGRPAMLADDFLAPVVFNFRSNDVLHGGQGAPFAPLYHQALARKTNHLPLVVVNCGGISNVSIITENESEFTAYDTGPGNTLIDRMLKQRTGQEMDTDGKIGAAGKVNEEVLKLLYEKSVKLPGGENYFSVQPPKSLDSSNLSLINELDNLSVEDACRTLEAFTADCIAASIDHMKTKKIPVPVNWVVAGGGWKNPVILSELKDRINKRSGQSLNVKMAAEVGWNSDAMEAEVFAYLAVRSIKGLSLSLPGTTGVKEPLTGGELINPAARA